MKTTKKLPSRRSGSSRIGEISRKTKPRKMPEQKPGRSKQDYATPRDFITAIEKQYGKITFDLAATKLNSVCKRYYSRKQDSLKQPWPDKGVLYLNPPYENIAPWICKCYEHSKRLNFDGTILLLVPASIGSVWFETWGLRKAGIKALRPRLTFQGINWPYPKDLMLLVFKRMRYGYNLEVWKWK